MKLFEVKICRASNKPFPAKEAQKVRDQGMVPAKTIDVISSEYYLADHISQVIEKIRVDLYNKGVEVIGINDVAPVLADLTKDGLAGRTILRILENTPDSVLDPDQGYARQVLRRMKEGIK